MALFHIHSLNIPDGYEIETIAIEKAKSMASGYNEGMKKTDAKYKVYLHQDTYIINKNFLTDFIRLFLLYPQLGLIGVIGASSIPEGLWWNSLFIYGAVYHTLLGKGTIDLLSSPLVPTGHYQPVQAIDGLIMITQYDIPWREDLFQDWHFYDISQSVEFHKAGFQVGVPRQNTPWCIHDCGSDINMNGFEESRSIFIQYYSGLFNNYSGK